MSKSLGNSPDPLDLIAKYGADGLRFGLMRIAPQGQDIRFDEQQIVEGRNFCNKLWNACRFRLLQGPIDAAADPSRHALSIFAKDLLSKLEQHDFPRRIRICGLSLQRDRSDALRLRVGRVLRLVYRSRESGLQRPRPQGRNARDDGLRLKAHPPSVASFYTIRQRGAMAWAWFWPGSIQFAAWPRSEAIAPEPKGWKDLSRRAMARTLRATYNLPSSKRLHWLLQSGEDWVRAELKVIGALLNAESIQPADERPAHAAACPTEIGVFFLPLEGVVDPSTERSRLDSEMAKVRTEIEKVEAQACDRIICP